MTTKREKNVCQTIKRRCVWRKLTSAKHFRCVIIQYVYCVFKWSENLTFYFGMWSSENAGENEISFLILNAAQKVRNEIVEMEEILLYDECDKI